MVDIRGEYCDIGVYPPLALVWQISGPLHQLKDKHGLFKHHFDWLGAKPSSANLQAKRKTAELS